MRLLIALAAAALCGCGDSGAPPLASHTALEVTRAPFGIALVNQTGQSVLSSFGGAPPAPVPVLIADEAQPRSNPADALAYAPFGWVSGVRLRREIPASFFQGNQLFWNEQGLFVAATGIARETRLADRTEYELTHNAGPVFGPAKLVVTALSGGTFQLTLTPPAGLPNVTSTLIAFESPSEEGVFGLGSRKDAFNQRGLMRNVWTEQQNTGPGPFDPVANPALGETYTFPNGAQAAYHVEAALFGARGWSAWITQTEVSRLDLAAGRGDVLRWLVAAPEVTLLLNGDGLAGAVQAFGDFWGRAPAPPRYAYLPWIDVINQGEGEAAPNGQGFTGGERVRADVERIVAKAEETATPIGVIGMEGWHAVPEVRGLVADLRAKGYRVAGYWNMFTSETASPESDERLAAYTEARDQRLFVTDDLGADYRIVTNRQGISYLIDYTHPLAADYWRRQLNRMFDLGIEGFMHDFGELTVTGMHYADGRTHASVHNDYPRLFHRAARAAADDYARRHPGFEPFFYFRAGYTGGCASTPAVFPGDESTDFETGGGLPSVIPAMLNAALTGCYAFTTDVGGYLDLITPRTSKELLLRWSQLAAFTPVMRLHNSTFNQSVTPWDFDDETVAIFRRYARAKVKLVPLVDELARAAAAGRGIGPVRPLVLADASVEAQNVGDQWLLGDDLLVAPVIEVAAEQRSVYFPAGARWRRVTVGDDGALVPTADTYPGGTRHDVPVTLADIPLFLREAG